MDLPKARLVVVDLVYHQPTGEEATGVEHRYSRTLQTEEQPYERRLMALESWQPIDTGWLPKDGVGMMVLINDEGRRLQTNPTPAEIDATARRIIEITYRPPQDPNCSCLAPPSVSWLVLPGESMRAHPASMNYLYIRCQQGAAKFTLHLFPR